MSNESRPAYRFPMKKDRLHNASAIACGRHSYAMIFLPNLLAGLAAIFLSSCMMPKENY